MHEIDSRCTVLRSMIFIFLFSCHNMHSMKKSPKKCFYNTTLLSFHCYSASVPFNKINNYSNEKKFRRLITICSQLSVTSTVFSMYLLGRFLCIIRLILSHSFSVLEEPVNTVLTIAFGTSLVNRSNFTSV